MPRLGGLDPPPGPDVDHRALTAVGRTELRVTRLGLGTAPLAGLYDAVGVDDALSVVDAAVAAGIRFFDTAPLYGHGNGERRLGLALARQRRADVVVATKVGRLLRATDRPEPDTGFRGVDATVPVFDFSYGGVMRSVEESLGRLGLDRVDILHIHDPDDHFEPALDGAYRALAELRRAGTISAVGVGMNQASMLTDFARRAPFDCFLLAGRYSLLDQAGLTELLPLCADRAISVIVGGVYNSGILADPHHEPRFDYSPAPRLLVDRALAIEAVCRRHDVPLKAAAIQFPFGHPAVASVLTGARSVAELEENVAMFGWDIPPQLWSDLRHAGLLATGVPTPAGGAS